MLLKCIGFLLIVSSLTGLGFACAARLNRRQRQLGELILGFLNMDAEISYLKSPLAEVFSHIAQTLAGDGAKFFSDLHTAFSTQGKTVYQSFVLALNAPYIALASDDKQMILDFAKTLGSLDQKSQQIQAELLIKGLTNRQEAAKEEYRRYGRLIKSLGFLTGVLVFLLLA